MPVVRLVWSTVLGCALAVAGCRGESPYCPVGTPSADPAEIPDGANETVVTVRVYNPLPESGLVVRTELTASKGVLADPTALETTYACPFDVTGEIEICATTTYEEDENAAMDFGADKRRGPNVYLPNPLECSTTRCTIVTCPEVKNACPSVSSLTVEPEELEGGEAAVVEVVANDPDDNPQALVTTFSATYGTFQDPNAASTTYRCDPDVGGVIGICVVATDGDSSCDVERCTGVRCPGEPLENTCPIIESFTANPTEIDDARDPTTSVLVVANDPDDFPAPLRTELSADTGVFEDRFAGETTFTCGAPGPAELCVRANDGDPSCNETSCTTVQCPDDIPVNICPQLFVINGVPRVIPDGETSTLVQTRGQDTDGVPVPLTLTLNTLWGSFENTENIQKPLNVVEQNATYICDRPGPIEVCVDATDGACTKTLCDLLTCPDTIPPR